MLYHHTKSELPNTFHKSYMNAQIQKETSTKKYTPF